MNSQGFLSLREMAELAKDEQFESLQIEGVGTTEDTARKLGRMWLSEDATRTLVTVSYWDADGCRQQVTIRVGPGRPE